MTPDRSLAQTPDDSRYEFQRKLGAGGSGAVYLVRDRETGEQLALKQLHRADDRSIARLKREFRSLTNINHRNVIRLYDLGRSRDVWFLTMEYVEGTDVSAYLARTSTGISTTVERGSGDAGLAADELDRILSVFQQLAEGVRALHRAQVLHRDLKPSNVLVAGDRVVVVDFGLALEVGDRAATVTLDGSVAGTPAYMAPEQVQGRDWGEPNDWYAFGVMLYEALSGQLPIGGPLQVLLRQKLETDPVSIDQLVSRVPSALSRLCTGLLQRRPEERPTGDEVLAVLQACASKTDSASASLHPDPVTSERTITRQRNLDPAFVGREVELSELRRALDDARSGGCAAVHVRGVSGAGKSALVERFLDEIEDVEVGNPWVLRGRCYERETVPFKALDGVMDALVTQLGREDDLTVGHALPRDIDALVQLFPVLSRLSVVQRLLSPKSRAVAAPHTREDAEFALRDLFARLGSRRLIVLAIDDLHWGDLDSARIVRSWLEPPGIPGMLLLLSYRSDEVSTSPCLRLLSPEPGTHSVVERVVALGPLDDDYIRALCVQRFSPVPQSPAVLQAVVDHVVNEARGSPFLASQLTALASSELHDEDASGLSQLTIEALVSRRTALLSPPARRLLHVLSVASRPLPMRLALRLAAAAEIGRAALHELSGLGLVRTRDSDGERLLAVYHDRLREGVLAQLDERQRAELDRDLLGALEAEGTADAAWLHALARGAGERSAALRYGLIAAAHAMSALAFDHAAQLYRACLESCPDPSDACLELWQKLAVALAHAGHGRQAALAYLEAARRTEGERAIMLERSAASHLLRSGRFEEGEALVQRVLEALNLETPQTLAGLLAAIAWERAQLAVRGLRFTPRPDTGIPFWRRYGGYLCGELSIEIQPYDHVRAALFQARSLRMALDSGVPELIARALCVAATMASVSGGKRGAERGRALLDRATELAREFSSPLVEGNISSARAVCAMLEGRMEDVVAYSAEAERLFRDVNASDEGEYYHRHTVIAARISALLQLGRHEDAYAELVRTVNELRATENVGALLLMSSLRSRFEVAHDQAEKAMTRLELERDQLPPQRFGLLHAYYIGSVMRVGCATGQHDWALRLLRDDYERFQRSIFRYGSYFAVIAPALHARLLLNQSVALKHDAAEAAARVAGDLRMIRRASYPTAEGALARTHARLALLRGDRARARSELEASYRCFERLAWIDEAARDRWALSVLSGDVAGAAAALTKLREFGYPNPARDVASYYPELM